MKKFLMLALGCAMTFTLVACAANTNDADKVNKPGVYNVNCYIDGKAANNEKFGLPETAKTGTELTIKHNGTKYNVLVMGEDSVTEYVRVSGTEIKETFKMPAEDVQVVFNTK